MRNPVEVMFGNERVTQFTRDLFVQTSLVLGLHEDETAVLTPHTVEAFMTRLYVVLSLWATGKSQWAMPHELLPVLNLLATFPARANWSAHTRHILEYLEDRLRKECQGEPWAQGQVKRWWHVNTGTCMILFHRFIVHELCRTESSVRKTLFDLKRERAAQARATSKLPMAIARGSSDEDSNDEPDHTSRKTG